MPDSAADAKTWRQATLQVVTAVTENVISCGGPEAETFRKIAGDSLEQLKKATSVSEVLITAGVLSQAIAHYTRQTQRQVDGLRSGVSEGAPAFGTGEKDPGTGLPARAQAEGALREAINRQPQCYAVVFYLHRMQLTNARFGPAIGNQLIEFCSQHIAASCLRSTDTLFRWSGPAFVAIIERAETPTVLAAEIHKLVSPPLGRFFEAPKRSVYLPIKMTAEAVPLFDTNYADVLGSIETFVLSVSGQAGVIGD
jgi:GGDEF domain-containing protein